MISIFIPLFSTFLSNYPEQNKNKIAKLENKMHRARFSIDWTGLVAYVEEKRNKSRLKAGKPTQLLEKLWIT